MNKTVNINIGGLFFHIDEDAYSKLSKYFEAVKRSLTNSSSKEEVMKDIEMRVADILSEKQKSEKHVINGKDVDDVIAVMGQPEDYRIDDDASEPAPTYNYIHTGRKKLYRDEDKGMIGGVCTGLGHYFGVDSVWLRLFFLLLFFGFGSGVIAYIVLWIAMPKAVTTAEKLEMTGKPVNISEIEKKVKEEFDKVSGKIKNVDYDDLGNRVKNSAETFGSKLGGVLQTIFEAFSKVIGVIIIIFSSMALFGIIIASGVAIFSSSLPQNTLINHIRTPLGLETPMWIQGILFLLTFGIPFFFLFILGLKIVVTNYKSIGNIAKYTLIAVWSIALSLLITIGVKEFTQISSEGKEVKKELIALSPNDTLRITFKNNDFYDKEIDNRIDFRLTQDETNREIIYSNNVSIKILPTKDTVPYLQIEKIALGKSMEEARKRAEKIKYGYKIDGNKLVLDNYLISQVASKFRNQKVELYLYLPVGTQFQTDASVQVYDESEDGYFNLHFSSDDYIYKVMDTKVKCTNCPPNENDDYDDDTTITEEVNEIDGDSVKTVTVQVNNGKKIIKTVTKTQNY
jgi:phage shock protein PspC (stress-responsive transcriptional regulator)